MYCRLPQTTRALPVRLSRPGIGAAACGAQGGRSVPPFDQQTSIRAMRYVQPDAGLGRQPCVRDARAGRSGRRGGEVLSDDQAVSTSITLLGVRSSRRRRDHREQRLRVARAAAPAWSRGGRRLCRSRDSALPATCGAPSLDHDVRKVSAAKGADEDSGQPAGTRARSGRVSRAGAVHDPVRARLGARGRASKRHRRRPRAPRPRPLSRRVVWPASPRRGDHHRCLALVTSLRRRRRHRGRPRRTRRGGARPARETRVPPA